MKKGKEKAAIYVAYHYGPWFGSNDILICNESNNNQTSYANFGMSYELPHGYVVGSEQARNLLAGAHKFSTKEIEVFY